MNGGTYIPYLGGFFDRLNTKANLSGATFSGNVSIPTLTANTYYSGSTPLEIIIRNISSAYSAGTGVHTWVQNGTNTYTGGTGLLPTVNISSATLANLSTSGTNTAFSFSAATLSGGTIYSGNTELSSLFALAIHSHSQYATLSGAIFTGNVTIPSLSAISLSGGVYYSGSTPLETIISNIAFGNESRTFIQPGTNTYTGGTYLFPTVNLSSATLVNLSTSGTNTAFSFSATSISGGTYYSGSTPLETIIDFIANAHSGTSGTATYVQPGTNTYTGGTAANPTVNVSALTINTLNASGYSVINSLSGVNLSATTYYSGSSTLDSTINIIAGKYSATTYVNNGLNTYTGGTAANPSVNLSSATLANLSTSGTNTALSFSASTLSGGTIYSGSTNLYDIFDLKDSSPFNIFILTAGTSYSFSGNINSLSINKDISSPTNVFLPTTPIKDDFFIIKDRKGDSRFNPIIISAGTKTIDGNSVITVSLRNKPSLTLLYDGEEYIII